MKNPRAIALLLLGAAVLGACSPTAPTVAPDAEVGPAPAQPIQQATTVTIEPPATQAAGDTVPPATEPAAPPPVRTELQATDPTTVSLASGRPTLVEFFAFW